MKVMILPHVTMVGIYRSPKIPLQCLLEALSRLLISLSSQFNIFIGDFDINWFDEMNRRPLYNFFINDNNYRQLVSNVTTDNQTLIDHIYTNLPESQASSHIIKQYVHWLIVLSKPRAVITITLIRLAIAKNIVTL